MHGGDFMPQIRPITDLGNANEISELCHSRCEPIFITKNGYGDLVVMSIEAYEALTEPKPVDPPSIFRRTTDADYKALEALWDGLKNTSRPESD